jgi:hypothetical protein
VLARPFSVAIIKNHSKLGARKKPNVVMARRDMPRIKLILMGVRSKIIPTIGPRNKDADPNENASSAISDGVEFHKWIGTKKIRKKSIQRERDDSVLRVSRALMLLIIMRLR